MNPLKNIKIYFIGLLLFGLLGIANQGIGQRAGAFIGSGQPSLKAYEKAAKKAFKKKDYYAAFRYYQDALLLDTLKIENQFQFAEAARLYGATKYARDAYSKVINLELDNKNIKYPEAIYRWAQMEKLLGNYEVAESAFVRFQGFPAFPKSPYFQNLTNNDLSDIDYVDNTQHLAEGEYEVLCLDTTINTKFSEISPVWKNDQLYYASLRFNKINDEVKPPRKIAHTLLSDLKSKGQLWEGFNTPDKTTTHFSFAQDDSRIYFTICDYNEKSNIQCQIYYKDRIGSVWGISKKLPSSVNDAQYTSTHPSVGLDEYGDQVLYFVSNRLGGKGGLDIWSSKILGEDGFSEPINLSINTDENDITPFYHYPSNSLYFSSEGHLSRGGYDIYKISRMEGQWSSVNYLPEPLNTPANDFNYFLEDSGKRGFLVSSREENCIVLDSIELGCNDIFLVNIGKCNDPIQVIVNLFDDSTKLPLLDANVILFREDMAFPPAEENGNIFTYNFSSTVRNIEHKISIFHNDYESYSEEVIFRNCGPNEYNFYLKKSKEPCPTTSVIVQLYDEATGEKLNGGVVTIIESGKGHRQENPIGNEFTFINIFKETSHLLVIEREGYEPQTIQCTLTPCKITQIPIRLKSGQPCEPTLTVKIFDGKTKKPISNCTVSLLEQMPTEEYSNQSGEGPQTTFSNEFLFAIDSVEYYWLIISHVNYKPFTLKVYTNGCEELEHLVYLEPKEKGGFPDLLPISCYFENAIPRRQRGAIPDTFCTRSYSVFYKEYRLQNGLYQRAFIRGKTGEQRVQDRERVDNFFKQNVIGGFNTLQIFRDSLMGRLQKGESYVLSIRGYASNLHNIASNKKLAHRRVWSIKNYFIKEFGSSFGVYLNNGQLILQEISIGEVGEGFDDPNDRQNSVYNPISARQRRAEIIRADPNNSSSLSSSRE